MVSQSFHRRLELENAFSDNFFISLNSNWVTFILDLLQNLFITPDPHLMAKFSKDDLFIKQNG